MNDAVVSKGEFAAMLDRGASAVSNWIAAGKLSGDALVGEGRRQRIRVGVALQQLGMTLDNGQQMAQSRPILGAAPGGLPLGSGRPNASATPPAGSAPIGEVDELQLRQARAKTEIAEENARKAREDADLRRGRYMLAEEARAEMARRMSDMLAGVEIFHRDVARQIAEQTGATENEVRAVIRTAFRTWRDRRAQVATEQREAEPELIRDVQEEEESEAAGEDAEAVDGDA